MKFFLQKYFYFMLLAANIARAQDYSDLFISEFLPDPNINSAQGFLSSLENDSTANDRPVLFFTINTGQIFTEMYDRYCLLNPPSVNVFEPATYLAFSTAANTDLAPAVSMRADNLLTCFLKRAGTYELFVPPTNTSPVFFPATGATQVYVGLVQALVNSRPAGKRVLFVEKIPFFSGHRRAVTNFFGPARAEFKGFNDPSEVMPDPDQILVEFVTSPNTPDGSFRSPMTNANIIIADLVFSSTSYGPGGSGFIQQNLAWLREARAQGKQVLSLDSASKHFGRAGDRWGYIWFNMADPRDVAIFPFFTNFIFLAGDVSTGSGALFLNLISALLGRKDNGAAIFHDINRSIIRRHILIAEQLVKRYKGSQITSIPGGATLFAKISDPRISATTTAADVIFQDTQTRVNNGVNYGETSNAFIRVNLNGTSGDTAEFLNRLAGSNKFGINDVFISSACACNRKTIDGVCGTKTCYPVNPNDCKIFVNTKKGPVDIFLPAFLEFDSSNLITIKKINKGDDPVVVRSANFSVKLKKKCGIVRVQWSSPFGLPGKWNIIKKRNCKK